MRATRSWKGRNEDRNRREEGAVSTPSTKRAMALSYSWLSLIQLVWIFASLMAFIM